MKIITFSQKILKKKFLHEASFVWFGSLFNGLSLLGVNIVLARFLSKESYGGFSLAILALSTVAEMSDFGLNSGLLRFAPFYLTTLQTEKLKQLVKTIWRWRVILSLFLTIGGIVLSYPIARYVFGQPHITGYLIFSFLGIGGVILLGFLTTYLQAAQRFLYFASVQSLKGIMRLILVIILVFFNISNIYLYILIYISIPWIIFLSNVHILPRGFNQVSIDSITKKKLHSQLAQFSFWLTVASLTSIVASRIDQALISRFLNLEQVAIFSVSYQFIQFFPLLTQSLNSIVIPKVSAFTSKKQMLIFIRKAYKWIVPLFLIIGAMIYPSQFLINLLFDHSYDASLPVYLILGYSISLNILVIPISSVIMAFNKTHLTAFSGLIQLIVSFVLNFILIPSYGVMGAAYAFGFGILVAIFYNLICSWYLLKNKELVIT